MRARRQSAQVTSPSESFVFQRKQAHLVSVLSRPVCRSCVRATCRSPHSRRQLISISPALAGRRPVLPGQRVQGLCRARYPPRPVQAVVPEINPGDGRLHNRRVVACIIEMHGISLAVDALNYAWPINFRHVTMTHVLLSLCGKGLQIGAGWLPCFQWTCVHCECVVAVVPSLCCIDRPRSPRHASLRCGAGTLLQDIMSKDVTLTTPDTTLDELKGQFGAVSGLPVVKSQKDKTLVGVVSKKDLLKRGACVQDVRAASGCVSRDDHGAVISARCGHRCFLPRCYSTRHHPLATRVCCRMTSQSPDTL